MAKLKGELQADNGDVLYPHTSADVVFMEDGKPVQDKIDFLNNDRGYKDSKAISGLWSNIIANGKYVGYNLSDAPEKGTFIVDVSVYGNAVIQIGTNDFTKNTWRNVKDINGIWTGWEKLSTTNKVDISLLNGWILGDGRAVAHKVGSMVFITMTIKGGLTPSGTALFTLPVGFRPPARQLFEVPFSNSSWNTTMGGIWVQPSGSVVLGGEYNSNARIIINIAFPVE